MRPYQLIEIGDIYQRPLNSIFWTVVSKNDEDKMVEIACSYRHPCRPETIWKKHTDSLFNYKVG